MGHYCRPPSPNHLPTPVNQLCLDEESRKYFTINIHCGLYQYTHLPFGVASATVLFQRTMDIILQGLDGVICFIDDILITGAMVEEHMEALKKVLEHLRQYGVRIRRDKCFFVRTSVEYLGNPHRYRRNPPY